MTSHALEPAEVDAYHERGYLFPVPMMPRAEAERLRRTIEDALEAARNIPNIFQYTFNVPHLVLPAVHGLIRDARILDRVESVMGPDILLWSAGFFIKEARTPDYVGWHQDLRYWGLDDDSREMTAWLAIGDVTEANGAMKFIPGSHRSGIVEHRDTWLEENQLSRGQELAVAVDENEAVHVELGAGEMSLHHGSLFHASGPNRTDSRRIGLALRFVTPQMRQVVGEIDYATLVRGEDRFGHFRPEPEPAFDFEPEGLAAIDAMLRDTNAYFYQGAGDRSPDFGPRRIRAMAGDKGT